MKKTISMILGVMFLALFSMPNTAQARFWDHFKRHKSSEKMNEGRTSSTQEGTMPPSSPGSSSGTGGSNSPGSSSGGSSSGGGYNSPGSSGSSSGSSSSGGSTQY